MSRTAVYNWTAPDASAIALAQTVGAGANMVLNGHLANIPVVNPIVSFPGVIRTITLTSGANLSGLNFTITGYFLGKITSEVLAGPNANTVESVNNYESIISISPNLTTGVNTVSVGTGPNGMTIPYKVNNQCVTCEVSAHVIVTSGQSHISYTFLSSSQYDDANFSLSNGATTMYNMVSQQNAITMGAHGMLLITASGAGAPTYNLPVYAPTPIKWCWVDVTNTIANPGSLLIYITQQGIT